MPTFNSGIDWSQFANNYATISDELQRKKEFKEQQKSDVDTHAIVEAQLREYQQKTQQLQADTDTQNRVNAFRAGLHFDQSYGKKTPEQQASYLDTLAIQALQAGDEKGAQLLQGLSSSIPRGAEQFAAANYAQARAKLTDAQIPNVVHAFDQKIALEKLRISGQERTAAIRAIHAAARAGGNPQDKAYQQALQDINQGTVRAAVQSSIDAYTSGQKDFQQGVTDAPPTYQAPTFNIQMTTGPNGQQSPIITPRAPGGGQRPAAQPPAPQGGGNPFSGIIQGVENFLHIGQPQDKFTKGQVYTDAKGRHAKYMGNGQWQPVP